VSWGEKMAEVVAKVGVKKEKGNVILVDSKETYPVQQWLVAEKLRRAQRRLQRSA